MVFAQTSSSNDEENGSSATLETFSKLHYPLELSEEDVLGRTLTAPLKNQWEQWNYLRGHMETPPVVPDTSRHPNDGRLSRISGFASSFFASTGRRMQRHSSRQVSSKAHRTVSQYGGASSFTAEHSKTGRSFLESEDEYGRQWLEQVYRCECEIKVLVRELLAAGESLSSISRTL
nr:unnamed protein product [Spirometra erinaceieuropaei]